MDAALQIGDTIHKELSQTGDEGRGFLKLLQAQCSLKARGMVHLFL